jgi:hypothetical protein
MEAIEQYCDRALWLESGRVRLLDRAPDVVRAYERASRTSPVSPRVARTWASPSHRRVRKAMDRSEPDRVPLEVWAFDRELQAEIDERYGGRAQFLDRIGADVETALVRPPSTPSYDPARRRMNTMSWQEAMESPLPDPDDASLYEDLDAAVRANADRRPVFAHLWGVFEAAAYRVGFDALLDAIASDEARARALFGRLGTWTEAVCARALDTGAFALSLSDDCAGNQGPLIAPERWAELVFPYDRDIAVVAHERDTPISFHSHGTATPLLDSVARLGASAVHPVATWEGVDEGELKRAYGGTFCFRGGLDIGFGVEDAKSDGEIVEAVRRVMGVMKPGGGFIFGTNFVVEKGVSLAKLEIAYDAARELGRYR